MNMTTSQTPSEPSAVITPVIDYEPVPVGVAAAPCAPPTARALRRRSPRPLRIPHPVPHSVVRESAPPRAAVVFADSALRRVLEVIDRRRPVAQLRPLVAPALIDTVLGLTRGSQSAAATLRRVRVRMVDASPHPAAEVFATYTRGARVRAVAARIELAGESWRIVALQLG
jgi:hypothetical protein